jgi:hypothetical protein
LGTGKRDLAGIKKMAADVGARPAAKSDSAAG